MVGLWVLSESSKFLNLIWDRKWTGSVSFAVGFLSCWSEIC